MNDTALLHAVLLHYARQRARELQREASSAALTHHARHGGPTTRLERVYYQAKFLFWFAAALPAALSVLLIESRGFTLGQIGALFGFYALTVALCEVPSGMLADLWGRKRTALAAYLLLIAAQLALFFAFSLQLLFVWALLYGVGRALVSGALEAWFVDAVEQAQPGSDMQPRFATAGTVELLALTLGTVAGGLAPRLFAGLPEHGLVSPLSAVLLLSVLVYAALFGVVRARLEEIRPAQTTHTGLRPLLSSALTLSRQSPALRLLFSGSVASGFALAGLETFWQPRFAALIGTETFVLSLILGGSFAAGILGNLASIPLSRLLGGRHALALALTQGLSGLAFVGLALQSRIGPAALLFWLVYLALGSSDSPLQTLFNRAVPSGARAAMLSVGSLMTYVGYFFGSLLLGQLAQRLSISVAWGVAGTVLFVSLGFYLQLHLRLERENRLSLSLRPQVTKANQG